MTASTSLSSARSLSRSMAPQSSFAGRLLSSSWSTWPSTGTGSDTPTGRWQSGPTAPCPPPPCTPPARTPGARWGWLPTAPRTFRAASTSVSGDSVAHRCRAFASRAESDDPRRLREALRLVRGPLFAGLRRTDWAVFDGTQSRDRVAGRAHRAARRRGVHSPRPRERRRVDGPAGAPGQPLRRVAVPRAASGHRRRRGIGSDCARPWPSCSPWPGSGVPPGRAGGAGRGAGTLLGCLHPADDGALPWPAAGISLPPERTSPGCRVATRHGEKLLREIGRPRRRNGRWRHLSRADAGELVCRARGDRPGRARVGGVRQVPLQPNPDGRRADHEHHVARRARLRHLRDDGAGPAGLAHERRRPA